MAEIETETPDPAPANAVALHRAVMWAGIICFGLTLAFFMALAILPILGYTLPCTSRFPAIVVLALTGGIAAGLIGGSAKASGQLAIGENFTPITFGATGGIATLLILLILGWILYGRCEEAGQISLTIQRGKTLQQVLQQFEGQYDVNVTTPGCQAAVLATPVRPEHTFTIAAATRGIWLQELADRVPLDEVALSVLEMKRDRTYKVACAAAPQQDKPITSATEPIRAKPADVVPEVKPVPVPQLPESSKEAFSLLRDVTIFDLRAWRPVPAARRAQRESPVNMLNYLHVVKRRASDRTYTVHYATSGYGIDLRCITHRARILQESDTPEHQGAKSYAVEIDVSDEAVDKEFLLVIEGTYWNGFRNLTEEDAATYTDSDISTLNELALVVLLPETKPAKAVALESRPDNGEEYAPYRGLQQSYQDFQGRFVYWSIKERRPEHHYRIRWTW